MSKAGVSGYSAANDSDANFPLTVNRVSTEMSLHVLAYNLKRVIAILGVEPLVAAMRV